MVRAPFSAPAAVQRGFRRSSLLVPHSDQLDPILTVYETYVLIRLALPPQTKSSSRCKPPASITAMCSSAKVRSSSLFVPLPGLRASSVAGLYPGTIFHSPEAPSILGADAVGILVSPASHPLANKRVLVAPAVGWHSSPLGPDVPNQQFGILGSVKQTGGRGTFADFVAVGKDDVIECPEHLSREEAAAVPLGALTAWRATFTKANVREGDNVLITGIGGGVAILALQLAVAKGPSCS